MSLGDPSELGAALMVIVNLRRVAAAQPAASGRNPERALPSATARHGRRSGESARCGSQACIGDRHQPRPYYDRRGEP